MNTNYIFVIPNDQTTIIENENHTPDKYDKMYLDHLQNRANKIGLTVNGEKVIFKTNEPIIQVWWTGSGSTNWADHGLPEELCGSAPNATEEECLHRDFMVGSLPYHLIENLKEGETLEVEINGKKTTVAANQLNYRYRRFGKFEEALEKIL